MGAGPRHSASGPGFPSQAACCLQETPDLELILDTYLGCNGCPPAWAAGLTVRFQQAARALGAPGPWSKGVGTTRWQRPSPHPLGMAWDITSGHLLS